MRIVRAGIRVFSLPRSAMSVVVCALLVGRILGSLLWILCTFPVVRRVAVLRFSRRLRRGGLDREAAVALVEDYAYGLSLFGHSGRRGPRG